MSDQRKYYQLISSKFKIALRRILRTFCSLFAYCFVSIACIELISTVLVSFSSNLNLESYMIAAILDPYIKPVLLIIWSLIFAFCDKSVRHVYFCALNEGKVGDGFWDIARFVLRLKRLYVDIAVTVLFFTFGTDHFRSVIALFDKNSAGNGSYGFSVFFFIVIPYVVITYFFYCLRLYRIAPALDQYDFKYDDNKIIHIKDILRIAIYIFDIVLLPNFVLWLLFFFGTILKLALQYIDIIISVLAVLILYNIIRTFIKRKKIYKQIKKTVSECGAEYLIPKFAYLPNFFFPKLGITIINNQKIYKVYFITSPFKFLHLRFYSDNKYRFMFGIVAIGKRIIKSRALKIPITPKIKLELHPADENTKNVIVINPICKTIEFWDGQSHPMDNSSTINGAQVYGGTSFCNALDRVLRGVHDFDDRGKFQY